MCAVWLAGVGEAGEGRGVNFWTFLITFGLALLFNGLLLLAIRRCFWVLALLEVISPLGLGVLVATEHIRPPTWSLGLVALLLAVWFLIGVLMCAAALADGGQS